MKTRVLFLLLAGFLVLPVESYSQIGYLRNRIINKIIDDQLDSLDQQEKAEKAAAESTPAATPAKSTETTPKSGSSSSGQGSFNLSGLGLGKVDIKHNDEYSFNGSIYMQMETYDKKDVSKMDYYTYYNSATPNAAIEVKNITGEEEDSGMGTSVFLFDGENKCFLMLTENDGEKSGIISTIPNDTAMANQGTARPVTEQTVVKTGKTRVIAGYKCDEYRITDVTEKTYSNVWATKDVVIKADRSNWGKAGLPSYTSGFEGGMVLAMESYSSKDEIEMKMETIEIKNNIKHTVTPKDYSLIQMKF